MRYTTVIDITEIPAVYKNQNARLVYLHLALKSGYHDNDRDLVALSIRKLACDTGLTVSATRHALGQLEKARLLARQGPFFFVRKWIVEQPITARAKTAKQQKQIETAARRQQENEQREREMAIQTQRRELLEAQGKTPFMVYYENLLAKAAAGDAEAAAAAERNKKAYEQHKAAIGAGKSKDGK